MPRFKRAFTLIAAIATILATYRGASARAVAVVLGGSVAEGHPALHGLHHGQTDNVPGQIAYALEQATGMRVLNQGVGGETCTEVVARWDADVPRETRLVWLNCGHNDFVKSANPVESIQAAVLEAKARAMRQNVRLIVQNLGPNPSYEAKVATINRWLETLDVTIVDFHRWALAHGDLFVDPIHPTKAGYDAFMAEQRRLFRDR